MKRILSSIILLTAPLCALWPNKRTGLSLESRLLQANEVVRLELINAASDVKIMDLFNGLVINMRNIPELSSPNFNINAVTAGPVSSVIFGYNGNLTFRTETFPAYAFCGNTGPDFRRCSQIRFGTHTITATPTLNGQRGPSLSITFSVVSGSPRAAPLSSPLSAPVKGPVIVPTKAPTKSPVKNTTMPVKASTNQPIKAPVPSSITPLSSPVSVPSPVSFSNCSIPRFVGNWMGFNTSSTKPYPIFVSEAQGAMIGNDFVITSGFKGGFAVATNETYALDMFTSNATWRRMDDMPFPLGLTHLGVAVNGMKAYLCGGYVGARLGIHNGSCFEYDHAKAPGGGQWTNFTSLPDGGRSGGGMIYDPVMNALVYAAGSHRPIRGAKSAVDFNNTWMYSLSNPSAGWVPRAPIPFVGNHMNFVTASDEFGRKRHFFFGGQRGDNETRGNTDEMYEYDAVLDTWTRRQSIPYAVGHAAASARAIGCGFIISGGSVNGGLTSAISYYDIPTNTWTKIGDLTEKTHANVCVIAKGILRCESGKVTGTFSWMRPITW